MEFGNKILSKELLSLLYESNKTVGTAESCTAGSIASAITMVPGASNYFKGGIVSYWDDVKINVLGVDASLIKEKTAVCEDVAKQMVVGAINALNVDYAIASTGFAGPGSEGDIPVGTIWIACGNKEEQITLQLTEDDGRDENVNNAVLKAMRLLLDFVTAHEPARVGDEVVELTAE
ncbi:MAG: CinA family protein [Bacteroidales bacterium]|nr:CinA family protein [Bacteroidales bacterium]MCM1147580.1 CinA family protein [Bacteroidales bacterium]MCM1206370.1 CinA family protein [Bacillota bacterium]MCM1509104.1 CinA family protein [Clostridium sp.]